MNPRNTDSLQLCPESWAGSLNPALHGRAFVENSIIDHPFQDWIFYYLILLLVAYAVARMVLGSLFSSTAEATFRYNHTVSMFKDNSLLQRQRDNVLYGLYFLSGGLFIALVARQFNVETSPFTSLQFSLVASLALMVIFMFRIFFGRIIGHIFFARKLFAEYLYHGFEYNKLMGIASLPLLLLIAFSPAETSKYVLYGAIGLFFILLLAKIWRSLLFSVRNKILNVYLFLYLCALEIAPYLLLYKWLSELQ